MFGFGANFAGEGFLPHGPLEHFRACFDPYPRADLKHHSSLCPSPKQVRVATTLADFAMSLTFTVLGATGNVGKQAANFLLDAGHNVRAVLRNADSEAALALKKQGATLIVSPFVDGNEKLGPFYVDEQVITDALTGVDGAYLMIPPNFSSPRPYDQAQEYINILVRAVQRSGVKKIVLLSSIGAHQPEGTGAIGLLHQLEVAFTPLAADDLRVVFIRAGYFYTNWFHGLSQAPNGILPFPFEKHIVLNMLSTDDIGEESARHLLDDHTGGVHVVELAGPKDYTFPEAAKVASSVYGKELNHTVVAPESAVEIYKSFGISQAGAEALRDMVVGYHKGIVAFEHKDKLTRGSRPLNEFLAQHLKR